MAFSGPVPFLPTGRRTTSPLGVVKVPYAKPRQIGLTGLFLPTYAIDPAEGPVSLFPDLVEPRLALTAFVSKPGDDAMTTGAASSVYVLDTSRLEQLKAADGQPLRLLLAPGATATLPGGAGTVAFEGLRRYAAFDVRYDPTKPWVLGAAVLALAGLTASLFVRRRRVWFARAPAPPAVPWSRPRRCPEGTTRGWTTRCGRCSRRPGCRPATDEGHRGRHDEGHRGRHDEGHHGRHDQGHHAGQHRAGQRCARQHRAGRHACRTFEQGEE